MNKNIKSQCCHVPTKISTAYDGDICSDCRKDKEHCVGGHTCYFVCTKCNKACDLYEGDVQLTCLNADCPERTGGKCNVDERIEARVNWTCRFHPYAGWHEVGCPHQTWTKEDLLGALIAKKEFDQSGLKGKTLAEIENMGANEMKDVVIAFDVDGTLIRNGGNREDISNPRIVELVKILASFKNVKIVVWSGGGKDYAQRWVRLLGLDDYVWKVASKTEHLEIQADIAIDDIQDTAIGKLNLIVREK